ncbi:hypothetical protein XaC1_184 [Xanthomonas phage XaC1]|nr:hypothetical protein XaC1_184 [Xanthomonas phage XaC1]
MKVFGIQDLNFFTDEHELKNYVHFTDSLEKAQEYVLKKYGVHCELDHAVDYDDDEEYGDRSVIIQEIKVQ